MHIRSYSHQHITSLHCFTLTHHSQCNSPPDSLKLSLHWRTMQPWGRLQHHICLSTCTLRSASSRACRGSTASLSHAHTPTAWSPYCTWPVWQLGQGSRSKSSIFMTSASSQSEERGQEGVERAGLSLSPWQVSAVSSAPLQQYSFSLTHCWSCAVRPAPTHTAKRGLQPQIQGVRGHACLLTAPCFSLMASCWQSQWLVQHAY